MTRQLTSSPRKYRVYAHFNRVNMQRGDPRVWSVHYRGVCYAVESFSSLVTLKTDYRPNGRQPRATLRGWATEVELVRNRHAIIR